MSWSLGTLESLTGPLHKRQAVRIGRAAFLEPLMRMRPLSGTPPLITSLSMHASSRPADRALAPPGLAGPQNRLDRRNRLG